MGLAADFDGDGGVGTAGGFAEDFAGEEGAGDAFEPAGLAGAGVREDDVRYLPLRGGRGWGMVLVDAKSGAVVKMLPEPQAPGAP